MKENIDIQRVHAFLDDKMSKVEVNEFWIDVAAKREIRTIFYMLLIERWNSRMLNPQHKELAVKLYKESEEFKEQFKLHESENNPIEKVNTTAKTEIKG